jgi:CRISPR-associated protein Cas1
MSAQSGNIQLFITTHGTYLHVKDALFEVRMPDGAGGYSKRHFAAAKVRSVIFTVAGALSTEAVKLALEHHIDIVFSKPDGHPRGRIWHSRPGSTTRIRKQQLRASLTDHGLRLAVGWIMRKLEQQRTLLGTLGKHRKRQLPLIQDARERIGRMNEEIKVVLNRGYVSQESKFARMRSKVPG